MRSEFQLGCAAYIIRHVASGRRYCANRTMRATLLCDPRALQALANWLCRASVERTGHKREIAQPPRTKKVIQISVCEGALYTNLLIALWPYRLKCDRKRNHNIIFDVLLGDFGLAF